MDVTAIGPLEEQGVKFGIARAGPRCGCYLLLTELQDSEGRAVAWLVEYGGDACYLDDYEFCPDDWADVDKLLSEDEVEWFDDTEATLQLADAVFPNRLIPSRLKRLLSKLRKAF